MNDVTAEDARWRSCAAAWHGTACEGATSQGDRPDLQRTVDRCLQLQGRSSRGDGDNDDGGSIVGNAEFYIVKFAAAMNRGSSLMDAIDSVKQDVYEYGAAVLDPDTGDIRADLVERFECIGGDFMFLHLMKVLPAHRGRDIGLVAASRLD